MHERPCLLPAGKVIGKSPLASQTSTEKSGPKQRTRVGLPAASTSRRLRTKTSQRAQDDLLKEKPAAKFRVFPLTLEQISYWLRSEVRNCFRIGQVTKPGMAGYR